MLPYKERLTHTEHIFRNLSILKLEEFYYKLFHELSSICLNSYLNTYFIYIFVSKLQNGIITVPLNVYYLKFHEFSGQNLYAFFELFH